MSNVLTSRVRFDIPFTAMPDPVRTPPVVMSAVPPTPAKKPVVPVIPIVVKAAPRPAPITGANKPADRPMTKPPPMVWRKVNYACQIYACVNDAPIVASPNIM